MSFFASKTKFPPDEWSFWFNKYDEWGAWYSGEPAHLYEYYNITAVGDIIAQAKMWARIKDFEGLVHLPAADDIAGTSANLLFSELPQFKYKKDTMGGQRINSFIAENGFENLLLEGAELAAALSGCLLKIDVEPDLLKLPLVSVLTPSQFFPKFWRGRLWEVITFREIRKTDNGKIWRLFEKRSRNKSNLLIEYELYEGTNNLIGELKDINSIDETANLYLENIEYNNINGLGCVYVPNQRPNKIIPGSYLGINDYSVSLTLMDSLDIAWSSWMRDIELGMAQLFIDEELLTKTANQATGETSYLNTFSKYQKAFTKLNLTNWKMGDASGVKPIEEVQFELRVEEHKLTCEQLFFQIITQSGYSPQTFGLGDFGNVASGTALKILEHKSQLTREKKSRYWTPAIKELINQMQKIDIASNLNTSYQLEEIAIDLQDSIITDQKELSEVIRNLDQARAISTFTKVALQHPDWEESSILEEVDKILKENGTTPDILFTGNNNDNNNNDNNNDDNKNDDNKKE